MKSFSSPSRLVAFNTGVLYVKMLITVSISFYSTRLILHYLGATDYGIYSLIGGVVALLSFLHMSMAASTQRYLSFHQGTGDVVMQKKVFATSLLLHILIGIAVLIIIELAGLFIFNGFLNIPDDRISSAKMLYHFSALSMLTGIISVPFSASLTAHENMLWPSVVNIFEVVMKLVFAFTLAFFIQSQRLGAYGLFIAVISLLSLLLLMVYCLNKYEECSITNYRIIDKSLIKEIGAYSGWNLFSSLANLGRFEGFGIVLNLFLGTIANTAYGIANQVLGAFGFFAETMLTAVNPQIMKSEGAKNRERMLRIAMMSCKFGFFLIAFLAIPCIFEMPTLLGIWLKNIPEYAILFCIILLISIMINQLTAGLFSAIHATGNIKAYMIISGTVRLLTIPCAIVLFLLGYSVRTVLAGYIIIDVLGCCAKIVLLKRYAGLSMSAFYSRVVAKCLPAVCLSIIISFLTVYLLDFNFRFILTITAAATTFILSAWFTGLCDDEKQVVLNLIEPVRKIFKPKPLS